MSTVKIDLSEDLKKFVDQQAADRGYKSPGEYLSALVSKQRDLELLRTKIVEGANSGPAREVDETWYAELQKQASR
jgi:antitoxin ParD1/3/4